jgi:para-nitrobenzyl esterase
MLVGTVLNEMTHAINHSRIRKHARGGVHASRQAALSREGAAMWDAYRKAKPFDVMSRLFAAPSRQNAVIQAERNTVLGAASAYLYWFTWQTPILDGRPRAFHCSELPFVFDNTDRSAAMTGGTAESRTLGAKVADAWIAFAKKGDPNHLGFRSGPCSTPRMVP